MESESESIDIASIKLRALGPWQGQGYRKTSESSAQGLEERINAAETAPQIVHDAPSTHANSSALADTIETSALPSTVPESAHLNALLQSLPADALEQIAKKMSSENDATQELSASQIQHLVASKSRSVIIRDVETQHTLNEGDDGHIDITSDFLQPDDDNSDDENDRAGQVDESQPVEFSPTQTQSRLPYFPESQRFKTPAAAGRKRNDSGEIKDTPDLPRLDLRNGEPTPAHVLGLSQAFAATQAATSPFLHGLADPLSDRPSPNIDLKVRPATATTSSPMRPISEFKRATTEPASRYVPIAQSQAERNRRAALNIPDDDSEDEFIIRDRRLQQEIDNKLMPSSPYKPLARGNVTHKSSPVLPAQRSSPSPAVYPGRASQLSPMEGASIHDDVDISEAETEQESPDEHVQHSHSPVIDDEDKENDERRVQIPRTTARLQRVMDDNASEVDQSPSLRRGDLQHQSSAPVAVANSQPSQPFPRSQRQQPKSSSNSGVDFVPQSQAEPSAGSVTQFRKTIADDTGREEQHNSSAPAQLGGTIPETSSLKQIGQMGPPVAEQFVVSRSMTNSNFETAPTRLAPSSHSPSKITVMSSPPIITTPPGRKRRRMTDISPSPSPQQSTQGFDAADALNIDTEAIGLSQSPIKARMKRRKVQPSAEEALEIRSYVSLRHPELLQPKTVSDEALVANGTPEPALTPRQSRNTQRSSLRRPNRAKQTQGRATVWDVAVSPQKPLSPNPREEVRSASRRRSFLGVDRPLDVSPQQVFNDILSAGTTRQSPGRSKNFPQLSSNLARKTRRTHHSLIEDAQETRLKIASQPGGTLISPESKPDSAPSETSTSVLADEVVAPDMVFACFNGKTRAYYPARCLERMDTAPMRYRIRWEGFEPDEIDAYGVKALDIRIGDHVKINMKGFAKVPYVVRGFKKKVAVKDLPYRMTDIRGFDTIVVAPKQRKSLPAEISTEALQSAPLASIYLDNNMWNQMKNRSFKFYPQIGQTAVLSGYVTPVETSSTPTTPSSRTKRQPPPISFTHAQQGDGIFANMAFAVSYDDITKKNTLVDLVRNNGGTIVKESFMQMLQPDSIDLRPQYTTFGFAALLADKLSRKEKYMQALALGLPCLSGKWIEACVNGKVVANWQTYLLPAGESDALDGAVRSRVLPHMNAADMKLADMLQSRPRPLEDATVAVVVGRGKAETKRKPYIFLIQALGAHGIRKFENLKEAADAIANSDIDWLFVEDRDVEVARSELSSIGKRKGSGCKVAGNELIVQSLILGKLFIDD